MKILQQDIEVNDFILRIKDDGGWVRLDIDNMIEADDYHLDFSRKNEIIAFCRLQQEHEEEYKKILDELDNEKFGDINIFK